MEITFLKELKQKCTNVHFFNECKKNGQILSLEEWKNFDSKYKKSKENS